MAKEAIALLKQRKAIPHQGFTQCFKGLALSKQAISLVWQRYAGVELWLGRCY